MPALLKPKHEIFCQNYSITGNGTESAEDAGYDRDYAANQAYRLLKRPDVQARLAEIRAEDEAVAKKKADEREARRARLAAMHATERETLLAKLDPVYEALLDKGEYKDVMKLIALQAEIAGHLHADDRAPSRRRGVRPKQKPAIDDESIV